ALTMSWPLVLAPLLLLFWLRRREISWPRLEAAVAAGVFRRQLGAGWFWAGGVFAVGATFLSVGLPLTDLCASGRTWQEFFPAFGWNTTAHALRSVDRDLSDSARLEGASRWQLLRHVHWPQVAPQLGAAWYLTYLFCLWDAETLILIMPPGAETLSVRVFNFLHYGHNPQVNALCLILLLIAVAPLALFLTVNARRKQMIPLLSGALALTC